MSFQNFIRQGGPADTTLSVGHGSSGIKELLCKSFSKFDFDHEFNFPVNINNREVGDIPNYHYRDDGLKLWHAIKDYVSDIINIFYERDEDVENDIELQEWDLEVYM